MGNGDNRRSLKARQRRAWRRMKMRRRKKIEGAAAPKAPAKKK